jgi:hypothetical protein
LVQSACGKNQPAKSGRVSNPKTVLSLHLRNSMAAEIFIQGITTDGKQFRPSDWAERLCGVMACFRPAGAPAQSHLTYSPYVRPTMLGNVKCVVVDERLRELEPLAYHFVLSFAKDNQLQTSEACLMPETPVKPARGV